MPVPELDYKPILVPSLLSQRARDEPSLTFREDYRPDTQQWHATTYAEFEQHVDSFVHAFLDAGLPLRTRQSSPDDAIASVPVVATLAGSSVADTAAYFAIIKMGCAVFPLSPRAPPEVIAALLQKHKAVTHLLFAPPFAVLATKVSEALQSYPDATKGSHEVRVMPVPKAALASKLKDEVKQAPAFTYDLDTVLEEEYDRPILLLHTSGSSGLPKVAKYTHRIFMVQAGWYRDPAYTRTQVELEGSRFFSGTPLFHAIGWIIGPMLAMTLRVVTLVPPPGPPPSVPVLTHLLTTSKPDRAMIVPSQLDEMSTDSAAIAALSSCRSVWYGGAPLGPQTQELLADKGVKLCSAYGLTETAAVAGAHERAPPSQRNAGGTWMTLRSEYDYEFVPAPATQTAQGKELFELVVKATSRVSLPFETSPGACATGDLCERHPDAPNSVIRLDGRIGDLVILSNGENVPTLPFESAACKHPSVQNAVVFGQGRPSAGLLVETGDVSKWSNEDLLQLMKLVDPVNREQPAFATVFPSRVLLATPNKPLPKTDKGTVKKKQALQLYTDEIAKIYETDIGPLTGTNESEVNLKTSQDVQAFVNKTLVGVLGVDVAELEPSRDLFDLGLDSLRSSLIRGAVIRAVRPKAEGLSNDTQLVDFERVLPASFAFENATPQKLVEAVTRLVQGDHQSVNGSSLQTVQDTWSQYSDELKTRLSVLQSTTISKHQAAPRAVLVSGTTGALGCVLLEQLVLDPRCARILCVNRARQGSRATGRERQTQAFKDRLMDQQLAQSEKLTFLDGNVGDLTIQDFGSALHGHRLELILHAAWPVRFDLPLSSFEKSISGLLNLLELAAQESAKLVFVSSVAAVKKALLGNPSETVLVDEDTKVPLEWALGGYGESKLIGERLVSQAVHSVSGLKAVSVRCGQLMGDHQTGVWNSDEWWPSVVRSATPGGLHSLPSGSQLGDVDWISMRDTATGMLSYSRTPDAPSFTIKSSTNVVHLINPKSSPASLIETSFAPALPTAKILPYEDWLKQLQAARPDSSTGRDQLVDKLSAIPALKLVETYEGMANADRHVTLQAGEMKPFLSDAVVLDQALATLFVKRWLA